MERIELFDTFALRELKESDYRDVVTYKMDKELAKNCMRKYSDDIELEIKAYKKSVERKGSTDLKHTVIVDGNKAIGTVDIEDQGGQWGLGYELSKDYWGRGIMKAATIAYLKHFVKESDIKEVHVSYMPDNIGSKKIVDNIARHYEVKENGTLTLHFPNLDKEVTMPEFKIILK